MLRDECDAHVTFPKLMLETKAALRQNRVGQGRLGCWRGLVDWPLSAQLRPVREWVARSPADPLAAGEAHRRVPSAAIAGVRAAQLLPRARGLGLTKQEQESVA